MNAFWNHAGKTGAGHLALALAVCMAAMLQGCGVDFIPARIEYPTAENGTRKEEQAGPFAGLHDPVQSYLGIWDEAREEAGGTPDLEETADLAMAHFKTGNFPEASRLFSICLAHAPNDVETRLKDAWCDLYLNRALIALTEFNSLVENADCADRRALFGSGVALLYLGRLDEAESIFTELKREDRENIRIQVAEGAVAYLRGDYEKAIRVYSAYLDRLPGNQPYFSWVCHAMNNLGWSYFHLGMYEAAADIFRRLAGATAAFNPEAFNGLAWSYHRMERPDDAKSVLAGIQQYGPGDGDLRAALGTMAFFEEKYGEAIRIYENCLEELPRNDLYFSGSSHVLYNLGLSHAATGNHTKAATVFYRLKTRHPAPIYYEVPNGLGWAYYNMGLAENAKREFDLSLSLAPDNPSALDGLRETRALMKKEL